MNNKYVKVVYRSQPIGKEEIVLELTTFDLEAFKRDEQLEKIPVKRVAKTFEVPKNFIDENSAICTQINDYRRNFFETLIEKFVSDTYEKQLEEMKSYIELNRKLPKAQWYEVEE